MSKVWVGYHVCPEVIKQVNILDVIMASSFLTPFPGSEAIFPYLRVRETVFLKVSNTIHCVALRFNHAFLVD